MLYNEKWKCTKCSFHYFFLVICSGFLNSKCSPIFAADLLHFLEGNCHGPFEETSVHFQFHFSLQISAFLNFAFPFQIPFVVSQSQI